MNWLAVAAVTLGLLLYLRSPIDLLPDRLGPLGLLDDLLVVLLAVRWLRRRRKPTRPDRTGEHTPPPHEQWDPHSVLGVGHDASSEEITRAYREQMKRYHPDRVADLGQELRKLAHQKAVEIQRAFAELSKR
jgi:DnaJ-domain-containing protein 1